MLLISLFVCFFVLSGFGVSVQVHHPVSDPLLSGHMWHGGGAVSHQRPRTLSVDPLRAQPGQPQLRDAHLHSGEETCCNKNKNIFSSLFRKQRNQCRHSLQ